MPTLRMTIRIGALCALLTLLGPIGTVAVGQVTTNWTDDAPGPEWNDDDNWDFDEPTANDAAKHTTSLSDSQVNITSAACGTYEGKGASGDRFLLIQSGKTLAIEEDLLNASGAPGRFLVRFEDGASGTPTLLTVTGFNRLGEDIVVGIEMGPVGVFGENADWAEILIGEDVRDSGITFGDDARVYVNGNVEDTAITMGNDANLTVIGSVSGPGDGTIAWDIGEGADVDVVWATFGGVDLTVGTTLPDDGGPTTVDLASVAA